MASTRTAWMPYGATSGSVRSHRRRAARARAARATQISRSRSTSPRDGFGTVLDAAPHTARPQERELVAAFAARCANALWSSSVFTSSYRSSRPLRRLVGEAPRLGRTALAHLEDRLRQRDLRIEVAPHADHLRRLARVGVERQRHHDRRRQIGRQQERADVDADARRNAPRDRARRRRSPPDRSRSRAAGSSR